MNQDGTGFTVANKAFRKATKNDLVYFENSPDYCMQDKTVGKTAGGGTAAANWKAEEQFLMAVDGLPWLCYDLGVLCVCRVYAHAWVVSFVGRNSGMCVCVMVVG